MTWIRYIRLAAILWVFFIFFSCNTRKVIRVDRPAAALSGSGFYREAAAYKWQQRDSLALKEILGGNVPSFLRKFVPVKVSIFDSSLGRTVRAVYYVSPDYLSLGGDGDWARVNVTPMAAQRIADSFGCFLPAKKMVDDIYRAAKVKLEPMPLYAFRDSTPVMYHHHLIVEGQRKGRRGLIAGIKKDVVISGKISRDSRPARVAIYGWHRPDGKPIQPLYTGHVNWWVDYSQGIRLVYRKIKVNGRWMDYTDVLHHPVYRKILCDEEVCDFYKYPY